MLNNSKEKTVLGATMLVILILLALWAAPYLGIMAANHLFDIGIEQTIGNWGWFWLAKITLFGTYQRPGK